MCLRVSRHVCRQAPKSVSRETGMSLSILNPSSNSVPPFLNCGCSYQRMLIYFEGHGWLIHSTSFFFPPIHYIFSPLWWTGCSCNTPSFQFVQQPLHLSTFILSFSPLSHLFSHFLLLPSSNTCCDSHDWQASTKGRGGKSRKRQCCRWTFNWSQRNIQTSDHGALMVA